MREHGGFEIENAGTLRELCRPLLEGFSVRRSKSRSVLLKQMYAKGISGRWKPLALSHFEVF